ncbi:MAG: hypothetical protein JOZ05_20100 [Acetobacteraceae bacterium]|nr:hypothetical protein [Acetobacteraceae bacterium]
MSKVASVVTAAVCLGALGACSVNTAPTPAPAPAPSSVVVTPPPPTVTTPGSTVVVPRSY